jgi:hypothetical protein
MVFADVLGSVTYCSAMSTTGRAIAFALKPVSVPSTFNTLSMSLPPTEPVRHHLLKHRQVFYFFHHSLAAELELVFR